MKQNPAASQAQLKASDPGATAWVNANAGSGKTHVLVDRVVRLMLGGTEPSRIMCLTFTKAAAAEMANRLFERLSKWIALDDAALAMKLAELGSPGADAALLERARQLFTRALETPGGLKIQTIHAFCERVLQLFPVEAGIVPHFTMLDDREAAGLLQRARNAVLTTAKADGSSPLGSSLLDIASRVSAEDFDRLLTQLLAKRASLRQLFDEEAGLARAESLLRQHLSLEQGLTRENLQARLACDVKRYLALAELLDGGSKSEKETAALIRRACAAEGVSLLDLKSVLLTDKEEIRKSVANKTTHDKHAWIDALVKPDQHRLHEALGLMGDLECLSATLSALRLGGAIVKAFEEEKRARGAYDFDDLIIKTGELLRERPDAAWVLYKLDGGIEHLLVDEAQDTSPMQWEIVRSLTDEFFAGEGRHGRKSRTLFVVGDRKQSIYSFQGADPGVFERVREQVKAEVEAAGQEFRSVDFSVSFRSAPRILEAVDLVFARQSEARKGLDGAREQDWHHEANRREAEGTVEIWPLHEPEEKEEPNPWQAPVDREPARSPRRRLAKELATTIKGWLGRRVLAARNRAVEPGDILILVRSRNSFFDAMIRALWNEHVPVAGADRLKLGENIAVLDLLALSQFALMPEDDHALACILKSPILAAPLSEEELMAVAAGRGGLSLWQSLGQRAEKPYADAVRLLSPLIAEAPRARPFEFLSGVLAKSRLRFLSRLGSEANDALDALLDRALDYEEAHGTSLAGFVNWFQAGEIEIKRNMEQGSGEVRVMTVHGAKGLEAPIVILPDTAGGHESKRSDLLLMLEGGDGHAKVPLWPVPRLKSAKVAKQLKAAQKDVEIAEYRRLLYVAMTRACDELYVCGYRGEREAMEHCWYNTVLAALKAGMTPIEGGRGWRSGAAPSWADDAAASSGPGPSPDWPAWIGRGLEEAAIAAAEQNQPRRRSGAGVERGILIHRILQHLPDLAEAERAAHVEAAVKRAGADPALASQLLGLIADPVLAEILSSDGHSEASLIAQGPEGKPERRRIDRLVITPSGILVADYKTDREVPDTPEQCNPEYLMQMAAYRDALRLAEPGRPLRFCLVWTEAPKLMSLPDGLLDRMAALRRTRP
ncbi:double-strand break repair helicase AddA [Aestuariivirga sp.]|uniref:double-strand break repair helicase AddA n=1 Tax=Aestuariivirga sp. TaxID=2650926 RepID=UPI0039187CAC